MRDRLEARFSDKTAFTRYSVEHDPQRLEPAIAKYREEVERLKAQQAKKEQLIIVELCHRP